MPPRAGTTASRGGTTASRGGTTAARSGAAGSGRPPARPGTKGPATKGKAARSKKQKRKRRLKIAAAVMGGMLALLCVFVGVVYASTEVPSPDSVSTKQTTIMYYSDGVTEMARLGDENRTNVPLAQISEPAQRAVLAAENRSFYTDPGISFTGIVRAAWNNVSGGSTQGGSTITQQYVKNAFLTSEQTFSRKFQELFLAIKLDNNFSKEQILENYLNTIYYGRGAYGIEAAANTYFGVPAAQLTAQQGAVLAVLVRSPSAYDPEVNPEGAQDRWGLVLDAMVEEGWLTDGEREASVYPPVLPKGGATLGMPTGPEGHIVSQVRSELEALEYPEQQINAGGLRITTTISKPAQDAAAASVQAVMEGEPEGLREALVAIDPRTGGIVAYYGGQDGVGTDYAQAQRQPGSSVKPYVLATALDQGIGIQARRDGSNNQEFEDRPGLPVVNSGGASCPACTLTEAMTRSLNTTYYGLAYEVGPENVRETIRAATGLPDTWQGGNLKGDRTLASGESGTTGSSIGIGEYEMRPIDQAQGFATLAAGGIYRPAHFIAKVTDSAGTVLVDNPGEPGDQVLQSDVVNDVTVATKGVAAYSKRSLDGGREVASKTGTQGQGENNSDAWMVGYTPSISAAVWMGNDSPSDPIETVDGRIIYGSGLPGAIWQRFMNAVLSGTPKEDLPDKALIRGDSGEGVAAPTTEAPAPRPTQPVVVDSDGDGVPDSQDFAPNDRTVTTRPTQPRDSDGDGVPDSQDYAPNDPSVTTRPADTGNPGGGTGTGDGTGGGGTGDGTGDGGTGDGTGTNPGGGGGSAPGQPAPGQPVLPPGNR
ncbi:transglycosylase domain-containing protein [Blastococcus sp. LR1]|uniref:transglycosylase domain-containing protein n=1 Tax=Blastococcus sp. LR1 TaxID=2877000 RepID=UPI001CCDDA08|nr:transglycosylase domain-containing protein [Blastococcus sp. LR1]MCA0147091.1 penicillin-binding protein [Blastococcus sp. LR1]